LVIGAILTFLIYLIVDYYEIVFPVEWWLVIYFFVVGAELLFLALIREDKK